MDSARDSVFCGGQGSYQAVGNMCNDLRGRCSEGQQIRNPRNVKKVFLHNNDNNTNENSFSLKQGEGQMSVWKQSRFASVVIRFYILISFFFFSFFFFPFLFLFVWSVVLPPVHVQFFFSVLYFYTWPSCFIEFRFYDIRHIYFVVTSLGDQLLCDSQSANQSIDRSIDRGVYATLQSDEKSPTSIFPTLWATGLFSEHNAVGRPSRGKVRIMLSWCNVWNTVQLSVQNVDDCIQYSEVVQYPPSVHLHSRAVIKTSHASPRWATVMLDGRVESFAWLSLYRRFVHLVHSNSNSNVHMWLYKLL